MPYIVKAGDNLSTIGARLGVDWRQMSGYRSGNPSLIYPGETITWPGDKPAVASAPAPVTPTAPVVQPKTAEQVLADQYGKDLQPYEKAINDIRDVRKGWNNIYTGGDTGYNTKDLTPEEQLAYKNAIADENADKYKAYLDALSKIQTLRADPYYSQKLAAGLVPDLNSEASMMTAIEAIMNNYMVTKTGVDGATYKDSAITGVGKEFLDTLGTAAKVNIQDADLIAAQNAKAREVGKGWADATASVANARDQINTGIETSGKRGGVSNSQLAALSSNAAGMMGNIAAEGADWRSAYMTDMNVSNQDYANTRKAEDILDNTTSIITNSPITNQTLKTKLNAYGGLT